MAEINSRQKQKLRGQARENRLSHAWLILGGSEQSREELAAWLAAALLCGRGDPPCGVCGDCVKLGKGIHPDLIRLEKPPDKANYTVKQLRELVQDAYVMPNEARRKVYLIPGGEDLTPACQNALLKTLEEPPARSAFILLAPNAAAMLDTVRSRCTEITADGEEAFGDEDKYARAICDSFLRGKPGDVAAAAFLLEKAKLDRFAFDSVLHSLSALLADGIRRESSAARRRTLFAAMDEVNELLRRRESNNVGAAHIAGALAVRLNRILSA